MFVDAANGDFRLSPGSPCLDAGDNAAVPEGLTTDLAGNARIQNGRVDIGACEGAVGDQPPAPAKPIADLAELAVVFEDVPEVTNNITTDSELAAFNDFLSRVGVTSAANLSAAQKASAYPSFALSGILVTPTLFETRPELKIDAFAPKADASGEWTLTVSLRAGTVDTAMVADRLADKIKVGADVTDITHAPTLTEVPSADGDTLTFAVKPVSGETFFAKIVVRFGSEVSAAHAD